MKSIIPKIDSRLSMRSVFDKIYTTRERKPPLKALILLTEHSPKSLGRLIEGDERLSKDYTVRVKKLETSLYKLRINKRMRVRKVRGDAIIDSSHKGCWIIYTDESGYFVTHVLETLFNSLYPDVLRVYFNRRQFKKLFEEIDNFFKGRSVLTGVSINFVRPTSNSFSQSFGKWHRKKGERLESSTFRLWERGAEEELEKQAKQHRIWIRFLSFEVKDEYGTLFQGSITSKGLIRLGLGRFEYFQEGIIQLFLNLAFEWKKFFSKRERRIEEGQIKLRPLVIGYPFELEKEQNIELVDKLLARDYSYSVIHAGNPYFVAELCDLKDGSSFGLTILGSNVTITPMIRSTPYGLWKLTYGIQKVIGEGEIKGI